MLAGRNTAIALKTPSHPLNNF